MRLWRSIRARGSVVERDELLEVLSELGTEVPEPPDGSMTQGWYYVNGMWYEILHDGRRVARCERFDLSLSDMPPVIVPEPA